MFGTDMEAIKIKKKIDSSRIVIDKLEKFRGKEVEIIIVLNQIRFSRKILNQILNP